MRKLVALVAILGFSVHYHQLHAQNLMPYTAGNVAYINFTTQIPNSVVNSKHGDATRDWKKHKTFKTAGWVALGVGVPLTLVGIITSFASINNPGINSGTGDWLAGAGLVSTVGSIPLFMLSSKYKRRAKGNMAAHISFYFRGNGLGLVIQR